MANFCKWGEDDRMDLKHLKFILKLLGYKNYRVSINKIQPEHGMKVSERDEICYRLCDQGLVEFTREVTKINISILFLGKFWYHIENVLKGDM